MASLPIIDLARAKLDPTGEAGRIVDVLETAGFAYVDNVTGYDPRGLWDACQWFFNKSLDFKKTVMRKQWNKDNENVYRGYFPIVDGLPSRKEAFEFARDLPPDVYKNFTSNWFYEPSTWPKEDGTLSFRSILRHQYDVMHDACLEILRLCAIGLGIPEDSFNDIFSDMPCSSYRLQHYPPWNVDPPSDARTEDGKVVTTPEHTDSAFMTLLTLFNFSGLEIQQADGSWFSVEPRDNSMIMNIGDAFSRMLGGRFKATRHRVLDIGTDRYSAPFFLEPKFDGDIGINFLSKVGAEGQGHIPQKYGPWVLSKMRDEKGFFEFAGLPEIKEKVSALSQIYWDEKETPVNL